MSAVEYATAGVHHRLMTMDLFGWPSACTVASLMLAPRLREQDADWRIALGEGPGGRPHAWCALGDQAADATYEQFGDRGGLGWIVGREDWLDFRRGRLLSLQEERTVRLAGRVVEDGRLVLGTSLRPDMSALGQGQRIPTAGHEVEALLGQLSRGQRAVVEVAVHGAGTEELGLVTGKDPATALTTLSRARRKLGLSSTPELVALYWTARCRDEVAAARRAR